MKNTLHLTNSVLQDDGFTITATEAWYKVKLQLIQSYLTSFVTNAASRVDEIIFVDLTAGSGLYSIGHKKELFTGSCINALELGKSLPIAKYVLVEHDQEQYKALNIRSTKLLAGSKVTTLNSNYNDVINEIKANIQFDRSNNKTAVFCLVDPFSMDVPFSLIERLMDMNFSLLMPFTFCINERLNYHYYLRDQREKLKRFAGFNTERLSDSKSNIQFYKNLVKAYQNNMLVSGFNTSLSMHKLNSKLMDLPFYYIGYFSKQISPKLIQPDVKTQEHIQFELF